MANLGTWKIDTHGGYETLASVTEETFTSGTTYTIQTLSPAYFREGTSGIGFLVDTTNPFQYTAGEDDLYVCTLTEPAMVNIQE